MESEWYETGYKISFWIVFVICYVYCIFEYGLLLGVGLGWIPSIICAAALSFLWPVLMVGAAWGLFFVLMQIAH